MLERLTAECSEWQVFILLAHKGSFGKTQDKLSTLAYHQKDILHSRIFQIHAVHTRSLSDANKA